MRALRIADALDKPIVLLALDHELKLTRLQGARAGGTLDGELAGVDLAPGIHVPLKMCITDSSIYDLDATYFDDSMAL